MKALLILMLLTISCSSSRDVQCPKFSGLKTYTKNKGRIPYVNASNCIDGKYYHKWFFIIPARKRQ